MHPYENKQVLAKQHMKKILRTDSKNTISKTRQPLILLRKDKHPLMTQKLSFLIKAHVYVRIQVFEIVIIIILMNSYICEAQ